MIISINTLVGIFTIHNHISAHAPSVQKALPENVVSEKGTLPHNAKNVTSNDADKLIKQYRETAIEEIRRELLSKPATKIRRVNNFISSLTRIVFWSTLSFLSVFKLLAVYSIC
jgi:DNA recombination-dependent growth factor C